MSHYQLNAAGLLVPFAPHLIKRACIEAELGARAGLSGEFKFTVRRADGQLKSETGWIPNMILNQGLNRLGSGGGGGVCEIGTGTATVVETQTSLATFAARTTTTSGSTVRANSGAPDYINSETVTYRFALGALDGNYTEVGVGWADSTLYSRALIVDVGGSPTSVTVLANEQLDVSYRNNCYMPVTDWGGTYTISGANYAVVGRRSNAASVNPYGMSIQAGMNPTSVSGTMTGFNGAIGAVTGTPSGLNDSWYGVGIRAYSNNSLLRDGYVTVDLAQGNLAGGIRSVWVTAGGTGSYVQYEFTPPIPKTVSRSLTLDFRLAWARRP